MTVCSHSAAPRLDTRFVRDFRACAGDRVKVEVTVADGEPEPTITWSREEEGADGGEARAVAVVSSRAEEVAVTTGERASKLALNSVKKSQARRNTEEC